MSISQKWMFTVLLWIFGALLMSVAFGDGSIGTLIQVVIQLSLTVYIWTRPTPSKQENISDKNMNTDLSQESEFAQASKEPIQEKRTEVDTIDIFVILVISLMFLAFAIYLLNNALKMIN